MRLIFTIFSLIILTLLFPKYTLADFSNTVYQVKVTKFWDRNEDGLFETNNIDWSIQYWDMYLYRGYDCLGAPISQGQTKSSGEIVLDDTFYGPHSVREADLPSWVYEGYPFLWPSTTGGRCQNVDLEYATIPKIYFGNIPVLATSSFPYLSQLDPNWKNLTYDHASSTNPYFCGTTIGGCGCAITSATMLLNYYGANKAPNGQPTNPATLNDWLNQNHGYAFGALKWNSIAAYSVQANAAFGTQKIRFVGNSGANDFTTLDADLSNSKPSILSEPGHFIVATQKDNSTYKIADPAYESRTSLDSYSNNFTGIRRFEKTNTDLSAIYISTPNPNELLITDALGRKAGKDSATGEVFSEIPNSYYFLEPAASDQTQQPNPPVSNSGVNTLVIINPPEGTFTLQSGIGDIDVSGYDRYGNIKTQNFSLVSPDNFEINFSPEPGADFNVYQTVQIEIKPQNINEGNGVIPALIKSDDNFNVKNIDFSSIRFTTNQISPVKFPLLVSKGNDSKKDLQIFFLANQILSNSPLCLTGTTTTGTPFKGCST